MFTQLLKSFSRKSLVKALRLITSSFVLLTSCFALSDEIRLANNKQFLSVSIGLTSSDGQTVNRSQDERRQHSALMTQNTALIPLATSSSENAKTKTQQPASRICPPKSNYSHHSFSIYDAFSYLLEDIDLDGYYQTFSVIFDADLHSGSSLDSAAVYAQLYLSQNGGPWVHYYTTDNFMIYGESDSDEFEVITTLHQGYSPDNYDVLIDLYQVGFNELVATYSSDDNNALYALPLESVDYDLEYVVEVNDGYVTHGGSSSAIFVFILLVLVFFREFGKGVCKICYR